MTDLPTIEELSAQLGDEDPKFRAWVEAQPDKHWAKMDLSALRVGYLLGWASLFAEIREYADKLRDKQQAEQPKEQK